MDEKKVLRFELDAESVQIKNALNKDFLPIHINAVSSALPNNNGSNFNKESQEISLPTWDNKPILGYFGQTPAEKLLGYEENFKSHEGGEITYDAELDEYYYDYSKATDERIIGLVVPGSAKVVFHEDDGLWWTECDALLFVKYNYKQVKNLLKSKKKTVSVEVEILASHEDENGIEIFENYSLMGITILGSFKGQDVLPGVAGASLTVSNFSKTENFQKQMRVLSFAYNSQFNSNKIQNKNDNSRSYSKDSDESKDLKTTESKGSEDTIYHTNDPQKPENEDWEEITFDDDKSDKSDKSKEKDGKENMSQMNFSLSYSARRRILDDALQEAINQYYGTENSYGYVDDFDDEYAYFYLDTKEECGNFCAPYTLTMKINTEEVDNCIIDLARKEKVILEWKRFAENDKNSETKKTDMNKNEVNMAQDSEKDTKKMSDDRGTEASKSGDDRAVPASKSGDDRGVPHSPATYEDDKDNKDTKDEPQKEDEACTDKECKMADDSKDGDKCDCAKEDDKDEPKKEDEAKEVTEVKSTPAGGAKEVTEVKSKSVNASEDEPKKEDEACTDADKECKMAEDTEKECNYEAKFAQLSADYVTMQKENETLKAVNAKFEADIADLMDKVASFEAESKARHNSDMYSFGFNMIEAESDLDEDCRKNMSAELKTECDAGKFASEDDVKKFTVTKIAMAYYEARTNGTKAQSKVDNSKNDKNNEKKDFVQNIGKSASNAGKNDGVSALTKARMALENLDSDEES